MGFDIGTNRSFTHSVKYKGATKTAVLSFSSSNGTNMYQAC